MPWKLKMKTAQTVSNYETQDNIDDIEYESKFENEGTNLVAMLLSNNDRIETLQFVDDGNLFYSHNLGGFSTIKS